MKILMITRLMSGFISSIEKGEWQPAGTPAIYRMIDYLDQSEHDLEILFTLKGSESIDGQYLESPLVLKGLSTTLRLFSGPQQFSKNWRLLRTYLSEMHQSWKAYRTVQSIKPDIVYIDRANVLLGAIIARWTSVPVYFRLLGTPPSLEALLSRPALSHILYRWAYRSPFRLVLCSRDGSPGALWMQRALNPSTPRKRWVNGVDPVALTHQNASIIRIVLIGRLNPLKRIDQAVDAILNLSPNSLRKIHVDIIGAGEQYVAIKNRIQASGFQDHFTLHGGIPHLEVLDALSKSDILISLNTHGNLTNTVLEAIRCGLCLVLPEADKKTGVDQDTYTIIPKDSVISLRQEHLLAALTKQLEVLINEPKRILAYKKKIQAIANNIDTWDQRIEREVQLLKSYDLVIVISDLRGGGTQKVLERLLKQWVNKGKRIAMVTLDLPEYDVIQLPDMVDRISLGGVGESSNKLLGMFANIKRLQQIRRILKRLNSPVVLSFLSAINVLTVLATRGLNCRLIISERNDPSRQSFGRIWDYLREKCYRYADIVTANSHSAIESLTKFVHREKCHYVPNPLVLPDKITPIALKKPTILAVGRLHVQKAYDVLLKAYALFHIKYPNWQLIILGEGALRPELEKQIKQLQLNHTVQLKGYADPFPYYAAADIYTMPSRYEGMPNALLEAMAMGMPSVISDALSGPLDFIENRKNALLVPVENEVALADAFSQLVENPNLQRELCENAKRSVSSFSLETVLPQWEVLFNA